MRRNVLSILLALMFIILATQPISAKTTLNVSFKKHKITISDMKATELIDLASAALIPNIKTTMKEELTDIIIEELIELINDDLMDLLNEKSEGNATPDLILELIEMINGYLAEESESLENTVILEIKNSSIKALEDINIKVIVVIYPFILFQIEGKNASVWTTENIIMPSVVKTVDDVFTVELPKLIEEKLPAIAEMLIDEIPGLLIGIVESDIRPMFAALVDAEIPMIIEDLAYKYLPRNLEMNVASLDLKTDINDYFAVGAGIKAIGILNIFMPEVSVSTYLKIINEPRFDMGIMLSGQALFLPQMDDIYALNAGLFFNYQLSNSFYLEGEVMVGTFISEPFGIADVVPVVGGYNFGLVFNVTEHLHLKAGYSVYGFSELAVTGLKYFLMDELELGTFSLSIGCHF